MAHMADRLRTALFGLLMACSCEVHGLRIPHDAGDTGGSGGSQDAACFPGANAECYCPTGQPGEQTCTSAGIFAACVCATRTVDAGSVGNRDTAAGPPDASSAAGGSDAGVAPDAPSAAGGSYADVATDGSGDVMEAPISLPVPTTIASWPFHSLTGSSYRASTDQLYVADNSVGNINAVTAHTHVTTVIGSGFNAPADVKLSGDGIHAYVADHPGTLLFLSLTNMDRAAATVVATGLNGIDEIALDEAHGFAYVAEFTGGHIQQINLATGASVAVATIFAPRGVLVTSDGRFIYVSNDEGTIACFDLVTNNSVVVASGLTGPRHLTWASADESVILFPQDHPASVVFEADLTTSPATVTAITGPISAPPYSVAVLSPNQLMVVGADAVSEVDLAQPLSH